MSRSSEHEERSRISPRLINKHPHEQKPMQLHLTGLLRLKQEADE